MSKNMLEGAIGYLAGPVTYVPDDGVTWRKKAKIEVAKRNIPISFFDPTDKPKGLGSEIGFEKQKAVNWKKNGEYDKVAKHVKEYRRLDLRMVDNSQFLVIKINLDIYTLGSHDELITAERQCKPIFSIVDQGKENAPDWLFAIAKHQEIFNTMEEWLDYMEQLNNGTIPLDKRWVLYNGKFI